MAGKEITVDHQFGHLLAGSISKALLAEIEEKEDFLLAEHM